MRVSDFIPLILLKARQRLFSPLDRSVYSSYEEALSKCSGFGYDQESLVDVVLQKTQVYRASISRRPPIIVDGPATQALLAATTALATNAGKKLTVIDVGGACGAHYFTARAFFPADIKIRWHVVETPSMVRKAEVLEDDELRFFGDLSSARAGLNSLDLMYSSGTLQYVPAPQTLLRELIDCNARFLLLSRLALTLGDRDAITVHVSRLSTNGPGPLPEGVLDRECRYPCVFAQKRDIDRIIQQKYRIRFQFDDRSGVFPVRMEPIVGLAYFAQRIL